MLNLKILQKGIIINISIFIFYLFLFSLFLFKHSGGADIGFVFLLFCSLIIHLVIAIIIDFKNKKFYNTLIILFLILSSIFLIDSYLNFMWWLTNKI